MIETRHLGVYGIIIKDDKILLVKKSRGAYTGMYDLPGGSIEHGEKPIETLKRELMEETGMEVIKANLIDANSVLVNWIHNDQEENMHHIGIIYDVDVKAENNKTDADGLDSLGSEWFSIKELKKDMISPLTYDALLLKGYSIK